MADAGGLIDGDYLYATSLTIMAKNLLLPILIYTFVSAFKGNTDLATLGFIVGTFPIGEKGVVVMMVVVVAVVVVVVVGGVVVLLWQHLGCYCLFFSR